MHVTLEGRGTQVRVEVGVGVVQLGRGGMAVEDLLHDAQHLAEAARQMPSRAATRDPVTGRVVPVEQAQLGPRRNKDTAKHHAPRAVSSGTRARA